MRDVNSEAVQETDLARVRCEIAEAADEVQLAFDFKKGKRPLPLLRRCLFLYKPDSFLDLYFQCLPYALTISLIGLARAIHHIYVLNTHLETARQAFLGVASDIALFLLACFATIVIWVSFVKKDGRA